MKLALRSLSVCLALSSLAAARTVYAQQSSDAPSRRIAVHLDIDSCVAIDHDEVRRIVAVELGAQPVEHVDAQTTLASIRCEGASLVLRVDDPITAKRVERSLDLRATDAEVRARLLAVAIVELTAASWAELDLPSALRGPSSNAPLDLRNAARDVVHAQIDRVDPARVEGAPTTPTAVESPAPTQPMPPRRVTHARRPASIALPGLDGSIGLLHVAVTQPSTGLGLRAAAFLAASTVWGFLSPGDHLTRVRGSVSAGWSPWRYIEIYASGRYTSTASTPGTTIAAFDTIRAGASFAIPGGRGLFAVGASAAVIFRSGNDGFDLAATGAMLRFQSSFDLSRTSARIPLRIHANLGYSFDNSAAAVSALERARQMSDPRYSPTDCSGVQNTNPMSAINRNPACHIEITRFERFAWDIDRSDMLTFASALETWVPSFPWLHAFAEYSVGAAIVSRTGYVCYGASTSANDLDACLASPGVNAFLATPSWLTLGVRGTLPAAANLSATLGVDIATSGTQIFVRELAPTTAWTGYLGFSIAP